MPYHVEERFFAREVILVQTRSHLMPYTINVYIVFFDVFEDHSSEHCLVIRYYNQVHVSQ